MLLVEIHDYHTLPPTVAARFWWSSGEGVTCDQPELMKALEASGITAPGKPTLYPKDGKDFFDLLPFRFNGLLRAHPATQIESRK